MRLNHSPHTPCDSLLRRQTPLFSRSESRPRQHFLFGPVHAANCRILQCVSAPEWCVSADDLEAEARRIGADPGERGVHVAGSAAPHSEEGSDWRRGEGGAGALWEQRDWGEGMLGPLLEVLTPVAR